MYLVHEDGYDSKVWEDDESCKQRKIHIRYLEATAKDRYLIN